MSRIADTFQHLREGNEKALILFVTAGDPALKDLTAILEALAEGGADLVEVGLPFSDPIADGPSIQASSQRALDRGVKIADVLEEVSEFARLPVVMMGYMNPMIRSSLAEFAQRARRAGVDGAIVCDLTPDEGTEWIQVARSAELDTVFLAAPTSTDDRLAQVCHSSRGFVYAVSRTGVTGSKDQPWDEAEKLVGRIRKLTALPVCVGFGISIPADVKAVCSFADGVIVGSRLVEWLWENWNGGKGRDKLVDWVRAMKDATRG